MEQEIKARQIGIFPYSNAAAITETYMAMDSVEDSPFYKKEIKASVKNVVKACRNYELYIRKLFSGFTDMFQTESNMVVSEINASVPELSRQLDRQFSELGCADDEIRHLLVEIETARALVCIANHVWDENAKLTVERYGSRYMIRDGAPHRLTKVESALNVVMRFMLKKVGKTELMDIPADADVKKTMIAVFDAISTSEHCKQVIIDKPITLT